MVRYTVRYVHSGLGRDLVAAGHVTGCRVSAVGPDPFKWALAFRTAALHGSWNADDTACYPTARQAMTGGMGGEAAHFLAHREEILERYGEIMFGPHMMEKDRRSRVKQITTAYDMGASLDFWKGEFTDAVVGTLAGVSIMVGGRIFSLEAYRAELARAADWMAERAEGMLDYLGQEDVRSKTKKGRKKRRRARPTLTLKSYVLQEAEAVGREAKIRAAAALGLRVVSLQHDGVAVLGEVEERQADVAASLSDAVSLACGYRVKVVLEKVRSVEVVD